MTERKNRKILMIFEDKELSILFTYSMLMIIFCYFGTDLRISIITANIVFIISRVLFQLLVKK